MIRLDCEQGSPKWRAARLGIPTASRFGDLITPKTGKPSASAGRYLRELCAEWLLGYPADTASSQFMQRGSDLEKRAINEYNLVHDLQVDRPGFILRDDKLVGCSPDGLVADEGGIEIKSLSAANHIGILLEGADLTEHRPQIQGCMWICERQWWDRVYFHPSLPTQTMRIQRDDEFIGKLATIVEGFIANLLVARDRLLALGCVPHEPYVEDPRSLVEQGYTA
jgi:hypothetical protein